MEESAGSLELRKEQINPKLDPVNVYLDGLRPGVSRESMFGALKRACKLLGLPDQPDRIKWEYLKAEHVEEIKCKLIERNQSQATINATLQALRGVAKTAYKLGLLTREDCDQIFKVKTSWPGGPLQHGLDVSKEDVLRMAQKDLSMEDSERNLVIAIRNMAIYVLITSIGLRPSQVASLDLEDYISDEEGGIIQIREEGGRVRQIPLITAVGRLLKIWIQYRYYGPGPLFPSRYAKRLKRLTRQMVWRIIKNIGEENKTKCSPRAHRKYSITNYLEVEKRFDREVIDDVQLVYGHAQKLTTGRYRKYRKSGKPGPGRKARY